MIDSLPSSDLRWQCDPAAFGFETTAEVEPIRGVVGQELAVEALRFGLECKATDQNVFVRGLVGSGRMTLIRRLLDELSPKCATKMDRCFVHNFHDPARPRLLSFQPGQAREFRHRMLELNEFLKEGLQRALEADTVKAKRQAIERRAGQQAEQITAPFQQSLREAGFALVSLQMGQVTQPAIFPVVDGNPVPLEELEQKGFDAESLQRYREQIETFAAKLEQVSHEVARLRRDTTKTLRDLIEKTIRSVVGEIVEGIAEEFPQPEVASYFEEVMDAVVELQLAGAAEEGPPVNLFGVHIVAEHENDACPVVVENTPTLANLLGGIESDTGERGLAPYELVAPGSLLRADGGYLILDARDALSEPGAWKFLVRTLRSGMLEIVPNEIAAPFRTRVIKPQPIPVNVRVILVGDAQTYHMLDQFDPDFGHLFKVLADFDSVIDREPDGIRMYASVLARFLKDENLPDFDRTALAELCEHGARIASRRGKLTARFARVADIAREAAFLSGKDGAAIVTAAHVTRAILRTKRRADLPSRRFAELIDDGTIQIQTSGSAVGQINGLAVMTAGPLTYGFPARITASIGPGSRGIINIEGQAAMSGSIHTKGFHILGGLLRRLLATDHPLAFNASLAFEQSYGGIDGDSASGAETCCLLSALTDVPIRQGVSMTGAIDQIGHIQSIGGVNEKVEGFFDVCSKAGLTGDQGVIIPRTNAGDLMLRQDVVDACADGKFRIWAVRTVHEAIEVLTGLPAGTPDDDGRYPEASVLGRAVQKAHEYWRRTIRAPETSDDE